jgi:hypothetical protein
MLARKLTEPSHSSKSVVSTPGLFLTLVWRVVSRRRPSPGLASASTTSTCSATALRIVTSSSLYVPSTSCWLCGTWTDCSRMLSGAESERRRWLPGQPVQASAGVRAHCISVADGQLDQLADHPVQHDDRHAADVPACWRRLPVACGDVDGPAQRSPGAAPLDIAAMYHVYLLV